MLKGLYLWGLISIAITACLSACAEQNPSHARVAVATNFLPTAQALETAFEAETDFTIDLISGSTGQLYTQIVNGAPYDAFFSADAARITRLIEDGYGEENSRQTYALGQLVLYGEEEGENILRDGVFSKLALANPDLAPYGAAAMETLAALQLSETLSNKIIYGQNVGQAYGFVKTGNADLAFAALSQMEPGDIYWRVPKNYYSPIRQDGVLLTRGEENEAAKAFMTFFKNSDSRKLIQTSGYELESE